MGTKNTLQQNLLVILIFLNDISEIQEKCYGVAYEQSSKAA